jgi:hypothetical protein
MAGREPKEAAMARRKRALRLIPLLAGAVVLPVTMMAGVASPEATHPPGNNGTVKVDDIPFDDHPNNEPHVGCVFEIDFYNYDEGDLSATYEFELWAPTGSGSLADGELFIGEDPNGGGTDLDASTGPIDLSTALATSGGEPHPIQGYHVRLTVHAEGSIGADVKHKMFWVTGCELGTQTTTTSAPPIVGGGGGSTTSPTVLGESGTNTSSPSPLAFTGPEDIPWLIAAGLVFLLLGTFALRLGSTQESRPPIDWSS